MGKFAIVGVCIALFACGKPQRQVRFTNHRFETNTISSFSTPADLRLAFLRADENNLPVYCAEPLPDVSLGSDSSFSASLAASAAFSQAAASNASLSQENDRLKKRLNKAVEAYERETSHTYQEKYSASGGASASQSGNAALDLQAAARLAVSVSELGGRSQQVLLAREFLYRICEARANNFIRDERTYERLQVNALRLIESVYTIKPASDAERVAAAAELIKQINANNAQQKTKCEDVFTACDAANAKKKGKEKCAANKETCMKAITLAKPPSFEGFGDTTHVSSILPPPEGAPLTYSARTAKKQLVGCASPPVLDENNHLVSCKLLNSISMSSARDMVSFLAKTTLSLHGDGAPESGTLLSDTQVSLASAPVTLRGRTKAFFYADGSLRRGTLVKAPTIHGLVCDPAREVDFYDDEKIEACTLERAGSAPGRASCAAGSVAKFGADGAFLSC